jgi:hypothetical protein
MPYPEDPHPLLGESEVDFKKRCRQFTFFGWVEEKLATLTKAIRARAKD